MKTESNFKLGSIVRLISEEEFALGSKRGELVKVLPDTLYTVITVKDGAIGLLGLNNIFAESMVSVIGKQRYKAKFNEPILFPAELFELATIVDIAVLQEDLIAPIPMIKDLLEAEEDFNMIILDERYNLSLTIRSIND